MFKTEPLFPPAEGDAPSNGEALGYAYVYDEEGNLLGDCGMGGADGGGGAGYVYLPTTCHDKKCL